MLGKSGAGREFKRVSPTAPELGLASKTGPQKAPSAAAFSVGRLCTKYVDTTRQQKF